jgi:hypothetical protein
MSTHPAIADIRREITTPHHLASQLITWVSALIATCCGTVERATRRARARTGIAKAEFIVLDVTGTVIAAVDSAGSAVVLVGHNVDPSSITKSYER